MSVLRTFDLTGDIDADGNGNLQSFQAGGGGDTPESVRGVTSRSGKINLTLKLRTC